MEIIFSEQINNFKDILLYEIHITNGVHFRTLGHYSSYNRNYISTSINDNFTFDAFDLSDGHVLFDSTTTRSFAVIFFSLGVQARIL